MEIIAIIIIILIVLIFHYIRNQHLVEVKVSGGEETYIVSTNYTDYSDAVALLSKVNRHVIEILRYMKNKYVPDEFTNKREVSNTIINNQMQKIVESMLKNYNPEVIIENTPDNGDTSYTINKGKKMYICIRTADTHKLIDYHTVLFVVLHELSHIGNHDGWGHAKSYWEVFKFVLHEANISNIYKSINYTLTPMKYCGLNVNYNPLFDPNLKDIWKVGR